MYIPMAEVLGCRDRYKIGNRLGSNPPHTPDEDDEARETVAIRFRALPAFEAAAEFYSYLAHPEPDDATQREKYRIALSRWAVLERAKIDPDWEYSSDASIRPIIFSQPEQLFSKTYRRGSLIWWKRAQCAGMILLPRMLGDDFLDGLPPSVGNIALRGAHALGYKDGSHKTIESRIWGPTKPVAHAAAAVMLWLSVLKHPDQEWDKNHELCYRQPFLATLFYEDVFRDMLLVAELLRIQLPGCRRFQIRAGDTVRFVAD